MGYKMKGFSYPGKSPVKQDDGLGGITVGSGRSKKEEKTYTDADLAAYKEYYKNLYGDSKKDPTLEDKYTKVGESKKEGMPEGTEAYLKGKGEGYNIWKDPKLKKSITDPLAAGQLAGAKATEGLVEGEMATSKAEIKQRKTKSKIDLTSEGYSDDKSDEERGFGKVGKFIRQTGKEKKSKEGKWLQKAGRKLVGISGKERKANKIQKLKDKEKLARATGKLSVTVDPLTGFKVTPQADKLAKRIKKKETKIAAKKTRKATKKIKTDAKAKTK